MVRVANAQVSPLRVQFSLSWLTPVAQSVDCPLRGTGSHGFDSGPLKNGTSCSSLGTQTYGVELGLVAPPPPQDNVTGFGIMSCVWCMILQWGKTIKANAELPVATRPRRDMTENCWKFDVKNQNKLALTRKPKTDWRWPDRSRINSARDEQSKPIYSRTPIY